MPILQTVLAANEFMVGQSTLLAAMDPIATVSRIVHILSAIILIGGLFYARLVLLPARESTGVELPEEFQEALRKRRAKWVGIATLLVLVSGIYNIVVIIKLYDLPKYYHPLFGIKFLAALGLLFLAASLAGRSEAAKKMREKERFWLNIACLLAVVVVCLGGVLKMAPHTPKEAEPQQQLLESSETGSTETD